MRPADPYIVAWDLVGQAEHGYNSPVWARDHEPAVGRKGHGTGAGPDQKPAGAQRPECGSRMARLCGGDRVRYARGSRRGVGPYRAGTSDRHGAGPGLVARPAQMLRLVVPGGGNKRLRSATRLPARTTFCRPRGAARYTGGLSVHKYMKIVTWQRATREGCPPGCRSDRAHFPAGGHGRSRTDRRYPSRKMVFRRRVSTCRRQNDGPLFTGGPRCLRDRREQRHRPLSGIDLRATRRRQ